MNTIERATRNKLHNLSNPYQGESKRVLCCCSASLLRSPTAAIVLHRELGYNTRSCGLDDNYALVSLSEALLYWSDEIVVMDAFQKSQVQQAIADLYEGRGAEDYLRTKPIIVLGIRDEYGYMDDKLQELIIRNYKEAETASALQLKIAKDLNIRD